MYLDPTGQFIISLLLTLGTLALSGIAVGIVGQLASDLVTSVMVGEFTFSSWEDYLGSAIGGAIGGMLSLIPGFGYVAAVIGGTIGTFAGLAIGKATGSNNMSWADIGIQTGISMGVNIVAGLFTAYLRVPGITKGSHSFTQVWKSGVTRLFKYGHTMHLKTAAKGFVSSLVSNFSESFLVGACLQGIIKALYILRNLEKVKS